MYGRVILPLFSTFENNPSDAMQAAIPTLTDHDQFKHFYTAAANRNDSFFPRSIITDLLFPICHFVSYDSNSKTIIHRIVEEPAQDQPEQPIEKTASQVHLLYQNLPRQDEDEEEEKHDDESNESDEEMGFPSPSPSPRHRHR